MLDIGTPGKIHRLRQIRAVLHIQRPEQLVVTKIKFGQVPVAVSGIAVTDLQSLQLHRL